MKINRLYLENFRNFEALQCDFDDVNIIWGENAQGKTNLLEAVYLFTGAKSFRGAKDKELIRFGENRSRLKMDFTAQNRDQQAEIIIEERRKISINGVKKKSSAALSEQLKAVVFSPVHLSMVKDGPSERRHFIDGALCQLKINYRRLLTEYQRALQQRNALLKDLQKHPEMEQMLYIWDRNVAEYGAKIIYQRLKYMEALQPYLDEVFRGISRQQETVALRYSTAYEPDVAQIEKALLQAFTDSKTADIINRITTKGPHREDMEILINGKSARTYASQGQQRSCVIALKLAEAELLEKLTGAEPIVLLDDVMSELDEARQDYVLNHIKSRQVFITCCDKETVLKLKQGKTLHMEKGRITD